MRDYIDAAAFKEMILCADAALAANTQMINDLNVFPVPDGDTGTNMGLTMNKAAAELRKKDFETIAAAADCVSSALLRGARGNSGVILSLLFRGIARRLKGTETAGPVEFSGAMADGVEAAYKAVMKPAEGTILTVSRLASSAAAEAAGAVPAPATQPGRGMLTGVALARAEAQAAAAHDLAPKKSRFDIVKHYPQVDTIDHSLALTLEEYKTERKRLQDRLFRLENIMFQRRVPLILMYEGWDAAGKGGNIKRVAQALDARAYTIFPSPAPTKPELAHPFLWRYWTRLPKAGHVGMYDRSWYGRVLVERVEGFATPAEWSRAYDEINEFEHDLVDWGAILLKFWVDVSPEEQLRRFQDREDDPAKQWKITEDDWRNREKYPQYKAAIDDMFRLTSTTFAPWVVLESDDKRYARIKALRIIVEALEKRLGECPAS